jgi:hypothetical protein
MAVETELRDGSGLNMNPHSCSLPNVDEQRVRESYPSPSATLHRRHDVLREGRPWAMFRSAMRLSLHPRKARSSIVSTTRGIQP